MDSPAENARPAVFREFPCKLSGIEIQERGEELARLEGDLVQQELEKKEDASTYNMRIKVLRAQIEHTAKQVRDGQEMRDVEIRELLVPENQTVITHRVDTGEHIGQRDMTEDEQQRSLFPRGLSDVTGDTASAGGPAGGDISDDKGPVGQADAGGQTFD